MTVNQDLQRPPAELRYADELANLRESDTARVCARQRRAWESCGPRTPTPNG
ncbi:hypothetical protein SAMN05421504_113160 [Amycolatopsis xylanica]|uniref:Uncharacterized protein n=1 Tax=Amycolatopsis xylanica TaxID=589385 RepID=A0A1H3SF25_9PSEU|nr:hypothetical protein [Amycolatopsis xylanica]SDZ36298.1 hypothetical protein SAMN05421504_113160 [Amycolatopsis xylanica]